MTKIDQADAVEQAARETEPPARHVTRAVEMSMCSPCRSKRGVAIFRGETPIASGYNFKPRGFDCDGTEACKSSCRDEAVHAEQFALLRAGRLAEGADMLHVKTVDGALVPSGGPSCVQCSKLALAAGIAGVWLFHEDGWRRYPIVEFHRRSLAARDAGPGIEAEGAAAVTPKGDERW